MGIKIGVLALQGNVSEHIDAFFAALDSMGLSGDVIPVRSLSDLKGLSALAIPGGESTTISRLIDKNGMREAIQSFDGGIFATCAGMVLMGTGVDDPRVEPLGLMDMTVSRNAFGRQRESFEADLNIEGLSESFHAVFIRAPVATGIGPGATVISSVRENIIQDATGQDATGQDADVGEGGVAVVQGKHMALSFHPELGTDLRLHLIFIKRILG